MTLLSFVAIIASVLAGLLILVSLGFSWDEPQEDTPTWKRIWWKFLRGLDFGEITACRRFGLKVLLSVLIVVAVGCGFWDHYSAYYGQLTLGSVLFTLFWVVVSLGIVLALCVFGPAALEDFIKQSRFELEEGSKLTMAVNIGYLSIWVATYVCLCCVYETAFSLIAVSFILAVVIGFVLTLVGILIYFICLVILLPVESYIKWLRK